MVLQFTLAINLVLAMMGCRADGLWINCTLPRANGFWYKKEIWPRAVWRGPFWSSGPLVYGAWSSRPCANKLHMPLFRVFTSCAPGVANAVVTYSISWALVEQNFTCLWIPEPNIN